MATWSTVDISLSSSLGSMRILHFTPLQD